LKTDVLFILNDNEAQNKHQRSTQNDRLPILNAICRANIEIEDFQKTTCNFSIEQAGKLMLVSFDRENVFLLNGHITNINSTRKP
jgi:hypothetical protein